VTILAIPVQNRVARRGVERKCFAQLLNDPGRGRLVSYRGVHDPSSFMVQHHEHPHEAECHGRHGEEIHPDQTVSMVAQKDQPALELVGRGAPPVLGKNLIRSENAGFLRRFLESSATWFVGSF